jgi:hypothetical protein
VAFALDNNLVRAAQRFKVRMSHGGSDFTIHVI